MPIEPPAPTSKPASSSLDCVFLVPTAGSWAVRLGFAASVLAGPAGFQISAPNPGSAHRYVGVCDFLDLTFYFSFAGLHLLLMSCCDRVKPDLGV